MPTMHALVVAETSDMPRDEWLALRRRGIGGSDAAAVLGLDPYRSPAAVYADKLGLIPDDEEPSEAAYWGTVLEDVVAQEFARRTGHTIRRRNAILRHPEHEWMIADVDRFVYEEGRLTGLLEVKTASAWVAEQWEDGQVPNRVVVQVQHYLAVTGLQRGYIAALIGGQRYVQARIDRDDELIAMLIEREGAFWRDHVLAGVPPVLDGSEASAEIVRRLYPEARPQSSVILPAEARDLLERRRQVRADVERSQTELAEIDNRLKQLVGEAEAAYLPGEREPVITWKNVESRRVDTKALKAAGLYDEYARVTVTRRWLVKGDRCDD